MARQLGDRIRAKSRLVPTQLVIDQFLGRLKSSPRIACLIGAGASAPDPTGIPTVNSLLPILWDKAAEISHQPLLRLREQCEQLEIRNIEHLLTAVYLAQDAVTNPLVNRLLQGIISKKDEGADSLDGPWYDPSEQSRLGRGENVADTGLVEGLRDAVNTLFSVLVGMMLGKEPNAIHKAVAELCALHAPVSVISTNYDVCVETALERSPTHTRWMSLALKKPKRALGFTNYMVRSIGIRV